MMSTVHAVPRVKAPARIPTRKGGTVAVRDICLTVIAVVSVAGLGFGIVAIATRPQTASLRDEVTSLKGAVSSDRRVIVALQSSLTRAASETAGLQGAVGSLQHRIRALHGGVASLRHGMSAAQGAMGSLQERVATLRRDVRQLHGRDARLHARSSILLRCVAQLEQEARGLSVQVAKVGGRLKGARLVNPTIISHDCTSRLER
jgi:chromosome segregation ATPase